MAKSFAGLKSFGSKAVSVIASGALALSLTPAIALASPGTGDLQAQSTNLLAQHYEYINTSGKAVVDMLNGKVKKVVSDDVNHVYQYMGYVHSDGQHYVPYSLYTKITTDSDGVITALDISSGNDTFGGKWGYKADGSSAAVIEGYLPDGVEFTAQENSDGTWSPVLSGVEGYSVSGPTVTLISTNADGTTDALGIDQNPTNEKASAGKSREQTELPHFTSNSGADAFSGGKITVPSSVDGVVVSNEKGSDGSYAKGTVTDANYYNLVKCAYTIGNVATGADAKVTEKATFNTYFSVGSNSEAANAYIDTIPAATWVDTPSSGYTTNRDGWTAITGTFALRMLASWGETLANPAANTNGLDGELGSIDTVSGATKTSAVFVEALTQAHSDGYVKGVSENVKLTIDGEDSLPTINVRDITSETGGSQDLTSVTKNNDGTYTVDIDVKRYGGGYVSLMGVYLYNLNGCKVGTTGMKELAKQSTTGGIKATSSEKPYVAQVTDKAAYGNPGSGVLVEGYGDNSAEKNALIAGRSSKAGDVSKLFGPSDDYAYKSDNMEYVATSRGSSSMTGTMTVKNKDVSHVVVMYLLGHAYFAVAYDLENMSKVADVNDLLGKASASNAASVTEARSAYDALPCDVRPFTTGIDNLEAQEVEIEARPQRNTRDKWRLVRGTGTAVVLAKAAFLLLVCWVIGAVRYLPPFPIG